MKITDGTDGFLDGGEIAAAILGHNQIILNGGNTPRGKQKQKKHSCFHSKWGFVIRTTSVRIFAEAKKDALLRHPLFDSKQILLTPGKPEPIWPYHDRKPWRERPGWHRWLHRRQQKHL